jgi:dienelactone hydrolase
MKIPHWLRVTLILFVSLGILAFVMGFTLWVSNVHEAMAEAEVSLESDAHVQVGTDPWISFQPRGKAAATGLILYPGGRVAPEAYAPPARAIAEAGYLVVIPPMPLNLAVLDIGKAAEITDAYTQIKAWAIGGHSLGGAMAAQYAGQHPEQIDGLVLWASHPAESNDLSDRDFAAVSIYGTRDGLADLDTVLAARDNLPPSTEWIAIEGGNHAGFGWYGEQDGDLTAAISREKQQKQVVAATLALLEKIDTSR